MKVKKTDLVKALTEVGMEVEGLPVARLQKKVATLEKFLGSDEAQKPKTADSKTLLKKIVAAVEKEQEVVIEDDAPPAKGKKAEKAAEAPAKKGKKAAKAADPEEDEDEEEDEESDEEESDESDDEEGDDEEESDEEEASDEDDEEESDDEEEDEDEAPKKKGKKAKAEEKPAKKKGKKGGNATPGRGPGIVKEIRQIMLKTSKKNPLTVEEICDMLKKKFPDHPAEGFKKTVTGQVSYFLKKAPPKGEKKLNIKNAGKGKGYFLSKTPIEEETAA
jgi:hypothetical protein